MDTGGEGWGGMNWEIRIDIYVYIGIYTYIHFPCVKQMDSGNILYKAGSSAWSSVMT